MHGYIQQIKGTSSLKNVLAIDLEPHLQDKAWVPSFIELYDRLKREGGLLFIRAAKPPKDVTDNPHVLSRLLAGQAVLLDFPREEECVPILHSLLERLNLKLTNRAIDYLIRRMPRNPLSFEVILAK
jgi:chromosomal replication initiation ATPase DnaA